MQPSITPAVFALLVLLARGERHGYALQAELEELTQGHMRLGPGTLYRSLQRMRVDGLVEEVALDQVIPPDLRADRRAERRRIYRITPAGLAAARVEAEHLSTISVPPPMPACSGKRPAPDTRRFRRHERSLITTSPTTHGPG